MSVNKDGRDYDKYVYFASKAQNYTLLWKPRVEEKLATGERRVAKDEKGNEMGGFRIEFTNRMLRLEKSKENEKKIEFIRARCEADKWFDYPKKTSLMPESRRMLKEVTKPIVKIPEDEVKKMMSGKDEKIKELEAKLAAKGEKTTIAPDAPKNDGEKTESTEKVEKTEGGDTGEKVDGNKVEGEKSSEEKF